MAASAAEAFYLSIILSPEKRPKLGDARAVWDS